MERINLFKQKSLIILKSIAIFLFYIILQLLLNKRIKTNSMLFLNIQEIIVGIIIMLIIGALMKDTLKESLKNFKKNKKENIKIALKFWLIGFLAMIIANFFINYIFFKGQLATNEIQNREIFNKLPIYCTFAFLIYSPFVEELIFRATYKKAFKNIYIYTIVSGLIFGLLHIISAFSINDISTNWSQILYIFPYGFMGAMFGYIYFKTNCIFNTMIVHFLHNCIALATILFPLIIGG